MILQDEPVALQPALEVGDVQNAMFLGQAVQSIHNPNIHNHCEICKNSLTTVVSFDFSGQGQQTQISKVL